MLNLVLEGVARLIVAVPGHQLCCRPPAWAAFIDQPWDTIDVVPWNLHNLLRRAGQWAVSRTEGV